MLSSLSSLAKRSFSVFLTLRYLRPKRSFVSLITLISLLGVTLGVWVLTGVMAIMTGYVEKMRTSILGSEAHLTIQQGGVLYDWPSVLNTAQEHPAVIDAMPFAQGQVAMDYDDQLLVVNMQAVAPLPGPMANRFDQLILPPENEGDVEGRFDLEDDYAVVGKVLAEEFGLEVGDLIVLHSLANGRELLQSFEEGKRPETEELIFPVELEVVGLFDSGRHSFDKRTVFVPLEMGQRLYNLGAGAHGIALHVEDPYRAKVVQSEVEENLAPPLSVRSWMDRNRMVFDLVAMQRMMMILLLFLITIVAGFCITNTMITVTTQKRREIGLFKSLGAGVRQIVGVFLGQGLALGLVGVLTGFALAFVTLTFRQQGLHLAGALLGVDVFSEEIYEFSELPARITLIELVWIGGGALLACALASLFPAFLAARMDAAKALRNESSFG
ncbi:MAG: ABC transporter permease [Verrucomicrobiota bacterium]